MITELTPRMDPSKRAKVGSVIENQPTPVGGGPVKVTIPELMSKMYSSGQDIHSVRTQKGGTLFLNAPDCRPTVSGRVKSQNYLTLTASNQIDWDGIDVVTYDSEGNIIDRTLPKGTPLNYIFESGIYSHGMVNVERDDILRKME